MRDFKVKKFWKFKNFLIVMILFFSFACNKKPALRIEEERESGSTVSLRNFIRESYKEDGSLQWRIISDEAFVYTEKLLTIFYNVNFEQFEKGKSKLKLKGDRAEVDNQNKKIAVQGHIVLITDDQKQLFAEEVLYDTESQKLTSDKDVEFISGETSVKGKGLLAEKSLNKVQIFKPYGITKGGNPFKKE
jgi:LPS export ABC transporter protein LptC